LMAFLPSSRSHRNPRPHRPLYFFFPLYSPPKTTSWRPPLRVPPVRIFSPTPPNYRHYHSVCCYVSLSNGGHPRTVFCPSLNFSMGAISAPQTKGPNAAHASPAARRLYWAHGEPRRRDSGPWRVFPWRGRAKPVGVGWAAAHLVLRVLLCVRVSSYVLCIRSGT
jgi:hypothetical protein